MPRKADPMIQTVVDLLPATGEVSYDEWKSSIISAGHYSALQQTIAAKRAGLVQFRNEINPDGSLSLRVGRKTEGQQG